MRHQIAGDDGDVRQRIESVDLDDRSREELGGVDAAVQHLARLYDMRFHVDRLADAYRQLITASRAGDLDRPAA